MSPKYELQVSHRLDLLITKSSHKTPKTNSANRLHQAATCLEAVPLTTKSNQANHKMILLKSAHHKPTNCFPLKQLQAVLKPAIKAACFQWIFSAKVQSSLKQVTGWKIVHSSIRFESLKFKPFPVHSGVVLELRMRLGLPWVHGLAAPWSRNLHRCNWRLLHLGLSAFNAQCIWSSVHLELGVSRSRCI